MFEQNKTPEEKKEELELVILAVAMIAVAILVYRNKDYIKKWFNELTSKFTA